MNQDIINNINSLPPLPETVIAINEFKKSQDKSPQDLVKIINKDPLILSTLLKASNSAMFGFKNRITTAQMAVSLVGVGFSISIIISSSIKNLVKPDLDAYGIDSKHFLETSNLSSIFMKNWCKSMDSSMCERLILPSFLHEIGKFIISMTLKSNTQDKEFLAAIKKDTDIAKVEEEFLKTSTSKVTAAIFEYWGLDLKLMNDIKYIDMIEDAPEENKKYSQALYINKKVCSLSTALNDEVIEEILKDADRFGFDRDVLEENIKLLSEI